MSHGSSKAVVVACMANAGIAAAKIVGFFLTGAASMLAEAIHSLADTGNQALLLFGQRRSQRAPTERHPFGYSRERYFWSFLVAMVLFVLGSVFAIYEGVHRLLHPAPLESPMLAVAILSVAAALEGWSFRTAYKEASEVRGQQSWLSFIRSTKAAELPVVLLEDVGALAGLLIALAGVGLSTLTGDTRFDGIGSIVIGVLLGGIATLLSLEMQSLLIGEAADPDVERQIRDVLSASPDVKRIIHMRTVHLGPDDLVVAAKLEFEANLDVPQLCARIDEAERAVRAVVPIARLMFIEPDVFRPEA
jgi:cation diffusion facilitator family transporter